MPTPTAIATTKTPFTNFKDKNAEIVRALKSGRNFTANQARTTFGVTNISARIAEIRKAGIPVYLNTRKTSTGRTIRVYTLGSAPRRVVVAGQIVASDPYFAQLLKERIDSNLALA